MIPRHLFLSCTAGLAAPTAAVAHHSSAIFDLSKEVIVEGAVAKVAWANPHIYLTIATAGSDGEPILQQVEVGPLSAVQTYGLKPEVVAQGAHVVVRANPPAASASSEELSAALEPLWHKVIGRTGVPA